MASEPDRPAHNWRSVLDHYDGRCWIWGAPNMRRLVDPAVLGFGDKPGPQRMRRIPRCVLEAG